MHIYAMIMAAGSGERMSEGQPKQLMSVGGKPMLAWSLKRIADRRNVLGVMVVTAPGMSTIMRDALAGHGADDVDMWVDGGTRRQDSVRLGLAALPADATHILIHDAARPCIGADALQRILDGLRESDAVVPAVPAVDTLVRMDNRYITEIVDRSEIAAVQTPQAFELNLIRRAHAHADEHGIEASDDGTLVLAIGERVLSVEGSRDNIKVTYPGDVALAEAILNNVSDI
jgi:2-C-methyl-D-erythritol 4-phosphate cytidylyltransferase